MAFVITEPCLGTCDTACVEVCPVDCIHGPLDVDEIARLKEAGDTEKLKEVMMYIDPDICIDCGACEAECPVEAIYEEFDIPDKYEKYITINEDFYM